MIGDDVSISDKESERNLFEVKYFIQIVKTSYCPYISHQFIYISKITNNADNLQVQEEMLENELPIVLEDEIPIVLEDDESARSRGSIDLLDDGDVVSLPDNTIDKTLSKVKKSIQIIFRTLKHHDYQLYFINNPQTFSIHKLSKHLHLHMSKPNCINQISFVREDDKLILPVVSTVHQNIEDATDEIRENLILEDEVPVRKL